MRTHALDYRFGSWSPINKIWRALAFVVLVAALQPATWVHAADHPAQQLIAARSQLREAQKALDEVTQRLKTELEASDAEWARLCRAVQNAEAERTRVQELLIAATRAGPEYIRTQEALAKAQETVRRLTEARQTAGEAFTRASEQVFAMRMSLRDIELAAMSGSPEMKTAVSRVQQCTNSMNTYWNRYASEVLPTKTVWVEAVSRRDAAAAAVKQAEASFAAAHRQNPVSQVRSSGSNRSRSSYRSSSGSSRSSSGSGRSRY